MAVRGSTVGFRWAVPPWIDPGPAPSGLDYLLAEAGDEPVYLSSGDGQALVWRSAGSEPLPPEATLPNYYAAATAPIPGQGQRYLSAGDAGEGDRVFVLYSTGGGGYIPPQIPATAILAAENTFLAAAPGYALVWA